MWRLRARRSCDCAVLIDWSRLRSCGIGGNDSTKQEICQLLLVVAQHQRLTYQTRESTPSITYLGWPWHRRKLRVYWRDHRRATFRGTWPDHGTGLATTYIRSGKGAKLAPLHVINVKRSSPVGARYSR